MQILKIPIPIFPYDVHYFLGSWNQSQSDEYTRRRTRQILEGPDGQSDGLHWNIGQNSFVWVDGSDRNATWYSVLMHENHHVTHEISRNIGIGDGPDGDEFRCYIMGYLSQKLFRKLWK